MCGIAGIISPRPLPEKLDAMLQTQAHRGPDHTGRYFDQGYAALGHNRLAIIDLSPEANEPFSDASGRYHLTFNGEIYNYLELRKELQGQYPFTTSSDAEVLLAAFISWGADCLARFNGMFAFAIWDSKDKKLFAARDRFGVKPFFYTRHREDLYFSSEIKALRAVLPRELPNMKVWAGYFCYGSYGAPEESFFEEIQQLPGGHFLEFHKGSLRINRWYDFASRVMNIDPTNSFEEAKEYYLQLLKDSISLRFRADVPVGFNISGGLDSSLLLALVNEVKQPQNLSAYTFYTGDERYDELPWVEQLIAATGNPLSKVRLTPEEVPSLAQKIAAVQDEPFGGFPSLAYAKIFEQARSEGVKVLLDGQGMDEQWAGYDYYQPSFATKTAASQQNIQGTGDSLPFRPRVLSPEFAALAEKPSYPAAFGNRLQDLQYRDLFHTKLPRALRFNDRVSMAFGTELREPFLDYRLVEFAFAQPDHYKINKGIQKFLLRDLVKPLLPSEIHHAPKRPLQTPQREWLGEELKDFTESRISLLKTSPAGAWFNFAELDKEWKSYLAGNNHSSFHVWQWINLALLQ